MIVALVVLAGWLAAAASAHAADAPRLVAPRVAAPEMKAIGRMIARGYPQAEIQARWAAFVEHAARGGGAVDPNALVQAVLREAYLQQQEDLRRYADKVKHFNEQKKKLRAELDTARRADPSRTGSTAAPRVASTQALEVRIQRADDDARLANVELQKALQKQQQTRQTMSSLSKTLHDTAVAVIRKIGR